MTFTESGGRTTVSLNVIVVFLIEGGQVQMPLAESFFAKSFGMVADRFGVHWMVIAEPKNPA